MQTSERSDSCLTFLFAFDKCMKKSRGFSVGVFWLRGWGCSDIKGIKMPPAEGSFVWQNMPSSPGFSPSCLPETSPWLLDLPSLEQLVVAPSVIEMLMQFPLTGCVFLYWLLLSSPPPHAFLPTQQCLLHHELHFIELHPIKSCLFLNINDTKITWD